MSGYVNGKLHQFNHIKHTKPQNQPYSLLERKYGTDAQKTKPLDMSLLIPTDQVNQIEQIARKFLYYKRGVDNRCQVTLSATESRIDKKYYMTTHQYVVIRFHALDMILGARTDASYLTEPKSHSNAEGYLFLGITPFKCAWELLNVLIHVNCKI